MGTKGKTKKGNAFTQLVSLTPEELARLPKPHTGFTAFAEQLFELYDTKLSQLPINGSTAIARQELAAYQKLLVQQATLVKQLALVSETCTLRGANVWSVMLDIYACGQTVSRSSASMLHEIDPFARFIRTRRKKAAPVVTPPVTTP